MAFCQNCGKELNPNQAVCLNCGVAVKTAQAPAKKPNGCLIAIIVAISIPIALFFIGLVSAIILPQQEVAQTQSSTKQSVSSSKTNNSSRQKSILATIVDNATQK